MCRHPPPPQPVTQPRLPIPIAPPMPCTGGPHKTQGHAAHEPGPTREAPGLPDAPRPSLSHDNQPGSRLQGAGTTESQRWHLCPEAVTAAFTVRVSLGWHGSQDAGCSYWVPPVPFQRRLHGWLLTALELDTCLSFTLGSKAQEFRDLSSF